MNTWLITGCSSGIGRNLAEFVLKKGDNAIVTARNIAPLEILTKTYAETALALTLDMTNGADIANVVQQGMKRFGSIDYLVNNAGYGYRAAVEEGDVDDVNVLFQTNFFGPIELMKAVLPQMRRNKRGAIVNISSVAAIRSGPGSGYYAASKAALELMTDGLAKEVAPMGIKVMIVEPGPFRTKFLGTSLKGTKNPIRDYAETVDSRRKENIGNNVDQPGDPNRGAAIIVETIEKEHYPMRLLLCSEAVSVAEQELANRMREVQEWKSISITADF